MYVCTNYKDPVIMVTSGEEGGLQVGGNLHVLFFIKFRPLCLW